jgi:DinB superfamily
MATSKAALARPSSGEYAPYYERYIALVAESDVVSTLERQLQSTLSLLRGLDEAQAGSRYAPDKWSIKELVGHLIDTERVFAYRAMRFARNDKTPLSGFEQDDFVRSADFDARQLNDLAEEFEHVRRANVHFFRALNEEAWSRRGTANDNDVTVRALAYIMAGHEAHHVNVLKTRYLQGESQE